MALSVGVFFLYLRRGRVVGGVFGGGTFGFDVRWGRSWWGVVWWGCSSGIRSDRLICGLRSVGRGVASHLVCCRVGARVGWG